MKSTLYSFLILFALSTSIALANADPYFEQYADVNEALRFPDFLRSRNATYTFSNFRTGQVSGSKYVPAWSTVTVDVEMVEKVTFMVCNWKIAGVYKAGHAQMIFDFSPGGCVSEKGQHEGLVASFEAYRGKGVGYSAVAGVFNKYKSIWIINSKADALNKAELVNTSVEMYELTMTDRQKSRLLETLLLASFQRERLEKTPYHTFRNSCITNQFDYLRSVIDWPADKEFPFTSVPRKAGRFMKKTGLVSRDFELECPEELKRWRQDGTIPEKEEKTSTYDNMSSPEYTDIHSQ